MNESFRGCVYIWPYSNGTQAIVPCPQHNRGFMYVCMCSTWFSYLCHKPRIQTTFTGISQRYCFTRSTWRMSSEYSQVVTTSNIESRNTERAVFFRLYLSTMVLKVVCNFDHEICDYSDRLSYSRVSWRGLPSCSTCPVSTRLVQ